MTCARSWVLPRVSHERGLGTVPMIVSGICRMGYLSAFSLCRLARVAQELWSRRLHRAAQQADAREAGVWMTAQSTPTWSRRRTPQPSVLGLLFLDGYDSSCKP